MSQLITSSPVTPCSGAVCGLALKGRLNEVHIWIEHISTLANLCIFSLEYGPAGGGRLDFSLPFWRLPDWKLLVQQNHQPKLNSLSSIALISLNVRRSSCLFFSLLQILHLPLLKSDTPYFLRLLSHFYNLFACLMWYYRDRQRLKMEKPRLVLI